MALDVVSPCCPLQRLARLWFTWLSSNRLLPWAPLQRVGFCSAEVHPPALRWERCPQGSPHVQDVRQGQHVDEADLA